MTLAHKQYRYFGNGVVELGEPARVGANFFTMANELKKFGQSYLLTDEQALLIMDRYGVILPQAEFDAVGFTPEEIKNRRVRVLNNEQFMTRWKNAQVASRELAANMRIKTTGA